MCILNCFVYSIKCHIPKFCYFYFLQHFPKCKVCVGGFHLNHPVHCISVWFEWSSSHIIKELFKKSRGRISMWEDYEHAHHITCRVVLGGKISSKSTISHEMILYLYKYMMTTGRESKKEKCKWMGDYIHKQCQNCCKGKPFFSSVCEKIEQLQLSSEPDRLYHLQDIWRNPQCYLYCFLFLLWKEKTTCTEGFYYGLVYDHAIADGGKIIYFHPIIFVNLIAFWMFLTEKD